MGLKCELKTLMQERGEQETQIKKFKDDVYEALHHISDFKKIKKSVICLYKQYVLGEGPKGKAGDQDASKSQLSRRHHYEQNVNHLRLQLSKDKKVQKDTHVRFQKENVNLIDTINALIKEKQRLDKDCKTMETYGGPGN